jgi:hypothetical protein
MTWIRIDDNFPDHPKIIGLSNHAFRTHIQGLCYCGRFLTDGFIPFAAINSMITEPENKPTDELESAGLWIRDNKGFHILNYQEYQSTKAEVEVIKARNRERTQKWREKHKGDNNVTGNKQKSNSEVTGPPTHTHTPIVIVEQNPIYEQLAQRLAMRIEANGSKPPTVTEGWITDIRLTIEKDGRTPEQVSYIIDWCQNDAFWRSNILSPSKLRAKFDQLRLNADKDNAKNAPTIQPSRYNPEELRNRNAVAMPSELRALIGNSFTVPTEEG